MSGILTEEMVEKAWVAFTNAWKQTRREDMRAALEAVLPLLGEAIAKEMDDEVECTRADAEFVRTLTASVEKSGPS